MKLARHTLRFTAPLTCTLLLAACSDNTGEGPGVNPSLTKAPGESATLKQIVSEKTGDEIVLPQSNHYDAPKASRPPEIDGVIEEVWSTAPWQPISVLWLGAQKDYPSSSDYSGRFKVLWDENRLYLLVDITDDVIVDNFPDPLEKYWNDDTVEFFIDENASGGNHQGKDFANAWAYHVSTKKDIVDSDSDDKPKLFNDHVDVAIESEGNRHIWEMSVKIFDDTYDDSEGAENEPVSLYANKTLGFSVSYIDNDNTVGDGKERESMIGSVNNQGHKDNQGYINADVFGSLTLVELELEMEQEQEQEQEQDSSMP